MKFNEKYPNIKPDIKMSELEGRLIKVRSQGTCFRGMGGCGQPTQWLDISWPIDVFCCSEECMNAMDLKTERSLKEAKVYEF